MNQNTTRWGPDTTRKVRMIIGGRPVYRDITVFTLRGWKSVPPLRLAVSNP